MSTGYIIGNSEVLCKLSYNQRNNKFWTIVYVRGGRGIYLLEDSLRPLNEGDLIIFPPKVAFSFASEDLGDEYNINLDVVVFCFDTDWLNSLLAVFPTVAGMILKIREMKNPSAVIGPKWIKLTSLLNQIDACESAHLPVAIISILELLSDRGDEIGIIEVCQPPLSDLTMRKEKIDRYLECNCAKKITLEQVADYIGMSRIYFSVFFKSQYGEGFADYVNRKRVQRSQELLLLTDKPLPSIASECGFKTVQYYNRIFKKITGTTPATYRKKKTGLQPCTPGA